MGKRITDPKRIRTLTDRIIKGLKSAASSYEIADAVVPGLFIRVMPSGFKSFTLHARPPGKSFTRLAIARYGEMLLADVRDTARDWIEKISQGVDPKNSVQLHMARRGPADVEVIMEAITALRGEIAALRNELCGSVPRRKAVAPSTESANKNGDRILTFADLKTHKGWPYSRVMLWRHIREGRFPKPFKIKGSDRILWRESVIDAFLQELASGEKKRPRHRGSDVGA